MARGNGSISTGNDLGSWKFLAPREISESISHDWAEYESIASRVAEKIGEFTTAASEVSGVYDSIKGAYDAGNGKSRSARSIMNQVAGGLSGNIPKYKIDSSLTYKDSKRRQYSLTFTVALTDTSSSTQRDVFEPIRRLEELSCAQVGSGLINIEFPAIFKI